MSRPHLLALCCSLVLACGPAAPPAGAPVPAGATPGHSFEAPFRPARPAAPRPTGEADPAATGHVVPELVTTDLLASRAVALGGGESLMVWSRRSHHLEGNDFSAVVEARRLDGAGQWHPLVALTDGRLPISGLTLVPGPDGTAWAAWLEATLPLRWDRVVVAHLAEGGWQVEPLEGPVPEDVTLSALHLDVSARGDVAVAWNAVPELGAPRVHLRTLVPGGTYWRPMDLLAFGPLLGLSGDDLGNAWLAWADLDTGALLASRGAGHDWDEPFAVRPDGTDVDRLELDIARDGTAVLALLVRDILGSGWLPVTHRWTLTEGWSPARLHTYGVGERESSMVRGLRLTRDDQGELHLAGQLTIARPDLSVALDGLVDETLTAGGWSHPDLLTETTAGPYALSFSTGGPGLLAYTDGATLFTRHRVANAWGPVEATPLPGPVPWLAAVAHPSGGSTVLWVEGDDPFSLRGVQRAP